MALIDKITYHWLITDELMKADKDKSMKEKNKNFLVAGFYFKTLKKAQKYAQQHATSAGVTIFERVEVVRLATVSTDE